MPTSYDLLSEWSNGQQPLTPVEAHWFSPAFFAGDDDTLAIAAYTTSYSGTSGPYNVTLTATALGTADTPSAPVTLASYTTGYNFHYATAELANGNTDVFYDTADGTNGVDIKVVAVDAQGHLVSSPVTLETGVNYVKQFRVASLASGGSTYVLAYATLDQNASQETIHYQVFNQNGTPVSGESGTLDSFGSENGESFGFATLQTSGGPDPSYVYVRASKNNTTSTSNFGLKYETVGLNGAPTGSQTFIEPPYPSGSTSQTLVNWTFDRISPDNTAGYDMIVAMRYSYVLGGTTIQAIDVQAVNAQTGAASAAYVIPVTGTDTSLAETRLPNGGFALGYDDGSSQPLKVQLFDNTGQPVGAAHALPSNATSFSLSLTPTGQLLVEWASAATGGNQLNYDILNFPWNVYSNSSKATLLGNYETISEALAASSAGNDLTFLDPGNQGLSLGSQAVTVNKLTVEGDALLTGTFVLGSGVTALTLSGATNAGVTGNASVNTITGSSGNNVLNGGAGADTLVGGAGNDSYLVDNAGDVVKEATGGGTDKVLAAVSYTLTSRQAIETLATTSASGTGAINLTGNEVANTIFGNAGNNILDGGLGNDKLYGYGGNDTFVFSTAPSTSNNDYLGDFTVGQDMIALSHAIYSALPVGALAASAFTTGSAATNTSQHVIYNAGTGALLYDADGSGSGAAVEFAHASKGLAMTASQFKVIA